MPVISSTFEPPFILRSGDIQSIAPALFRRAQALTPERQTLELTDGDFLHLEWLSSGNQRLAIISHGLEGSARSTYVQGMARSLLAAKWDVLTWSMRGCGGNPNRLIPWYHSGQSEDLRAVINEALVRHDGDLALVGFSIGGNITLKYLGEEGALLPPRVKQAVAVSVPMDLRGSAETLSRPRNRIYMEYLLRPLRIRIREKSSRFPGIFDTSSLASIKTFREFDERFTAPFHGFSSVDEYWDRSSSRGYLDSITIPTLAISAQDDPFLSPSCFPFEQARTHPHLILEAPAHGGHVGFLDSLSMRTTWLERRVAEFLDTSSC
jgi:predicted alpha/beta-fold hydrolase